MSPETKRCRRCGLDRSVAEFNRNRTHGDGRSSQCRSCRAAYRAKYNPIAANRRRAALRVVEAARCLAVDLAEYKAVAWRWKENYEMLVRALREYDGPRP